MDFPLIISNNQTILRLRLPPFSRIGEELGSEGLFLSFLVTE